MDKNQLSKRVGQLSPHELKGFLLVFLEENPKIAEQFCSFVDYQLSQVGIENANREVEHLFHTFKNVGDQWHSRWEIDWEEISYKSDHVFARANDALAAGNPNIALAIGVRWVELFAAYCEEEEEEGCSYSFEEEGLQLNLNCEAAEKVIDAAMIHPRCSDEAKKDAAQRLERLLKLSYTLINEFLNIQALSLRANTLILSDEEALKCFDELLENDSDCSAIIIQKYKLLKKRGRQEEADAFIKKNLDEYLVANAYVNDLLEDKRHKPLIATINYLTSSELNHSGCAKIKWLEILAATHEELGNIGDATAAYRQLFVESGGDLKYYKILKQRVAPAQWKCYLEAILSQLRFRSRFGYGKCNYADILVEEGLHKELHDWLLKGSSDALAFYLKKVPEHMRADLISEYTNLILDSAARARKRLYYTEVCSHLAKIKELPEGEPIAQEIATIIRNKYSRLPAFMDELRKVMG